MKQLVIELGVLTVVTGAFAVGWALGFTAALAVPDQINDCIRTLVVMGVRNP